MTGLLVEDNPMDAIYLRKMLSRESSDEFNLHHVTSLEESFAFLKNKKVDFVIMDLILPDSRDLDTFNQFNQRHSGRHPGPDY